MMDVSETAPGGGGGGGVGGGSGGGGGGSEWFRVFVRLERFFGDERARVAVGVRGGRRVRWLRRRLRRLLGLPRRVALLARGHLLPPDEPLALLRPDDVVEVIPSTIDLDKRVNISEPLVHLIDKDHLELPYDQPPSKQKKLSCFEEENITNGEINYSDEMEKYRKESEPTISVSNYDDSAMETRTTELSDVDELREVKERALALLDSCASPAAPARRRRVRRRKRRWPASAPEPLSAADTPLIESDNPVEESNADLQGSTSNVTHEIAPTLTSTCPASPLPSTTATTAAAAPAAVAWRAYSAETPNVVHNGVSAARVPRIVQPLPSTSTISLS